MMTATIAGYSSSNNGSFSHSPSPSSSDHHHRRRIRHYCHRDEEERTNEGDDDYDGEEQHDDDDDVDDHHAGSQMSQQHDQSDCSPTSPSSHREILEKKDKKKQKKKKILPNLPGGGVLVNSTLERLKYTTSPSSTHSNYSKKGIDPSTLGIDESSDNVSLTMCRGSLKRSNTKSSDVGVIFCGGRGMYNGKTFEERRDESFVLRDKLKKKKKEKKKRKRDAALGEDEEERHAASSLEVAEKTATSSSETTMRKRKKNKKICEEGVASEAGVVVAPPPLCGDRSKKSIVRAAFIGMLNRCHRDHLREGDSESFLPPFDPLSVRVNSKGMTFSVRDPQMMVGIILECLRAFSSTDKDGDWVEYNLKMNDVAMQRLKGLTASCMRKEDIKMWRSFQAILRRSSIGPSRMYLSGGEVGDNRDDDDKNEKNKSGGANSGEDWISDPEWFVAHDVVKGVVMDYREWHTDYDENGDDITEGLEEKKKNPFYEAMEHSVYGKDYVCRLKSVIDVYIERDSRLKSSENTTTSACQSYFSEEEEDLDGDDDDYTRRGVENDGMDSMISEDESV